MALIASQAIIEAGLSVSLTAPGETTNTFTNTGKEVILIENSSGSSLTCTVTTRVTEVENNIYGDLTKSSAAETVAANSISVMGTFATTAYNDSDSLVSFVLSTTTDVKIAILYIG